MLNNFKYIENLTNNDVKTLETIYKRKIIGISFSKNIYQQIHKLYRNIINIFNSMNDEGYKKYIEKRKTLNFYFKI